MTSVVAIVPAKDEATRIVATLHGVATIRGVVAIVVVDDGSGDQTYERALAQRAVTPVPIAVTRHSRNRGKAAAMATGAVVAAARYPDAALLFVDADLEASAAELGVLCEPVLADEADMTIAVLPPQQRAGGGFGFVMRLAREGIMERTGWEASAPLSGQRCLSRAAYDAASPLARGWGVEVGMTIDVLSAGLRVLEVPAQLAHRVTGKDWRSQVHRAKQYRDVCFALRAR
ncbi:glycosyltransferase family 2 protein [Ornithinimicrobium sp. Arc0846-15]|nr:glycosyltransferase family 2 protein [Ornithinimicrobium laminariae]